MKRRHLLLAAAAAFVGLPAQAKNTPPAEIAQELPDARHLGSGRLTWFGLHVYDARLWVGEGFDPTRPDEQPLALELEYARALVGRQIAERSLQEMQRGGSLDAARAQEWFARMAALFPDVKAGDRIVGVHRPGVGAAFALNGRPLGELRDAEFARRFFGIWLGPRTSQPGLRRALLGGADKT